MKGIRFYAEYPTNAAKRRKDTPANVVAVLLDDRGRPLWNGSTFDAIAAISELAS